MSWRAGIEATPPECALAVEIFDHLCAAGTMKQILALHREICNAVNLKPNKLPDYYPKLKSKLASSWKAQALFKKFDARANHKVYGKGRICSQTRVLIIGAGPCGLRAAIECQLLGAKVVVIEKRDRVSRNNVLHLWPFVIHDLRALGAKKFFGKFCAGSIDHISIRQLQCILLKVALLLGVEVHEGVSFEELLEPHTNENNETLGWRARVSPANHPVSQYEFDTLLGADGKRNTLHGFKRKEFRGKLAMAITANFINRHSEQEASVPEISGVAFIFNQKFFKDLYAETGIDLENIVYYKDDTHYFVMTAKKHSLLEKGVLLNDFADVTRLLSVENVDRAALMRYAQEAARFSTNGRLPLRDFALNHYGEPDVALFDFTSMYAAENASMVYERLGRRLLCELVGDSLLEPFWPTGSGCARGFLSALDAAWAVRAWGQTPSPHPLQVIAERESIYRLLAQTTPENLNRDFGGYTLDPGTRYPNLNRTAVTAHRVTSFYDSDEPLPLDASASTRKRRRDGDISEEALMSWLGVKEGRIREAVSSSVLAAAVRRYRPDLMPVTMPDRTVNQILQHEFGITPLPTAIRDIPENKLRSYLNRVYAAFKGEVPHVHHDSDVFSQLKQIQQKEKYTRNTSDQPVSVYTNAVDTDKSHSSYRKKRRSARPQNVSNDSAEYIRKKIGKLDINDINELAKLIEGHNQIDLESKEDKQLESQKILQEEIMSLFDPEESADPQAVRQSLAELIQGASRTKIKRSVDEPSNSKVNKYFAPTDQQSQPKKPPRKLKGMDSASIKYPDLSDIFDSGVDENILGQQDDISINYEIKRSNSEDLPLSHIEKVIAEYNNDGDTTAINRTQKSKRSNSVDDNMVNVAPLPLECTQPITLQRNREHIHSIPNKSLDKQMRRKRMKNIIEGKYVMEMNLDPIKIESIGSPEMVQRRRKVAELIEGPKMKCTSKPQPPPKRKDTSEMSFKMQRMSDNIQKKPDSYRYRSGGRRKAARNITKQRFEKSIQMLAAEPRLALSSTADLENDVGLQQYRASAPQFGERVMKLERKLQHYEEGRVVGGGGRNVGSGAHVARLAAELSGTSAHTAQKLNKPKDLMRSVGKIERDDWNVKEIEKKIMENRLGRPEPKTAEKVPKWDKEQFLGRQKRLKEGDGNDEKWVEIDETLNKFDQKLRDSGRPDHGTKKVANLANKFVKQEPIAEKEFSAKAEVPQDKKCWRGPSSAGVQCAACGKRVFAAEGVIADGLHLHRACFRCAICKAVLRPGNYTMERYTSRLVCLRHSGVSVPDAIAALTESSRLNPLNSTPERISLEVSDSGAREIDEDEWTDRNFLASETSGAGGLSDDDDSSSGEYTDVGDSEDDAECEDENGDGDQPHNPRHSELYFSDDSFGYDDYSDDGAESSGNESCSRMREAREARRREVPAEARQPTDSSEVESGEDESSSDESSATEVSTDSEFAREEPTPAPPSILVTEAPAVVQVVPPVQPANTEYPLSRTRSAGGLATRRALELKRKYLLGESSPSSVRKSDSTSQIDTKLQTFQSNITEFQKMLNPSLAPVNTIKTSVFQTSTDLKKPMPDIIKNLCEDAPVDLLTKVDDQKNSREWEINTESKVALEQKDVESDSLSEDSTKTATLSKQNVPRVEVHDEGGELVQFDSLTVNNANEKLQKEVAVPVDESSSESGRDINTLPLTETEMSDWAAESTILEDYLPDDLPRKGVKNLRCLSAVKIVRDSKNISAIASHVCGRSSPNQPSLYSEALDQFAFADEGEISAEENTMVSETRGYRELDDDDYNIYSPVNDRSMDFVERDLTETVEKSIDYVAELPPQENEDSKKSNLENNERFRNNDKQETPVITSTVELNSSQTETNSSNLSSSVTDSSPPNCSVSTDSYSSNAVKIEKDVPEIENEPVPSSNHKMNSSPSVTIEDTSPPLEHSIKLHSPITLTISFKYPCAAKSTYMAGISRSASDTFHRRPSRSTDSSSNMFDLSSSIHCDSGSISPGSPVPSAHMMDKKLEIKREREEQTEVVRMLVLERLGSSTRLSRKSTRRCRVAPMSNVPPPVPPPPLEPPPPEVPPPPSRPAPSMHVTPSLSDPELTSVRRSKSIIKSLSNYFNRRLSPRTKESSPPSNMNHKRSAHKSTGALEQMPPPVPPPPAHYRPPEQQMQLNQRPTSAANDTEERDAMQLWFEARWARLVAQRRSREISPKEEPAARRVARLERRLCRPLSAEQQAAAVAELVQVSAQREAHQAMIAADNMRRSVGGTSVGNLSNMGVP